MDITVRLVFLWLLICPVVFTRCSKDRDSKRRLEIIKRLCSLGEMRPLKCATEAGTMKIHIPEFPKQEEIRLPVLEMSFRIVSDLLMKNTSSEWQSSELHVLQELLGHQRQFYKTCFPLVSSSHAEVETWSVFWRSLTDYLSQKSFSSCPWESARTVILKIMRSFYRSTVRSPRPIRIC